MKNLSQQNVPEVKWCHINKKNISLMRFCTLNVIAFEGIKPLKQFSRVLYGEKKLLNGFVIDLHMTKQNFGVVNM